MKPLILIFCRAIFLCLTSLAVLAGEAKATVVLQPPDLNPGDPYRLILVTSGMTQALSPDIDYYNDFVDGYGDAVLASDWRAIGSTMLVNARDNTGTTGSGGVPLYRLDGQRVANDYADLWDESLITPIRYNELGTTVSEKVWTGTNMDGTTPDKRYLGTLLPSGNEQTRVGNSTGSSPGWIQWGYDPITDYRHMYAISSVLSVPLDMEISWATAWRDAANRRPPVQGRVRYEGIASGLDFSKDLTFTVTDGGTLDQSETLPAGTCTTIKKGWVTCRYQDPSVRKKVVRATFRPTGVAGEYRYNIAMNKLEVPQPPIEPLSLSIQNGTDLHEGSLANCTEKRKRLVCRD